MYNPLNSYLMLQQMHDLAARAEVAHERDVSAWPNRRWFHRAAHRAR